MKLLKVIILFICLSGSAMGQTFMGTLDWPTEAAAQASADSIHAWLIANNPTYANAVSMGWTTRYDYPHYYFIFTMTPPYIFHDLQKTQWYLNMYDWAIGALTTEQQAMVTVGPQTNLLDTDYTSVMTDSVTGIRDF